MEARESTALRDVGEDSFDADVVEASRTRPVVVDFWAAWCGPCHQLSPVLERVAARYASDVDLVKVDVDAAPALARRYGVQGIPAVKAFRDGGVVAEFVGVQPEQQVERFFAALAPSRADRLVAEAAAAPPERRGQLLREALAAEAGHAGALVALARLHVDAGEADEARALLDKAPTDPRARRLLAQLNLAAGEGEGDPAALRTAADAGDPQARLRLGRLLASRGDYDEALGELVAAVRHPATREPAREGVLEVFALLGDEHELVRVWRPKLAAALF